MLDGTDVCCTGGGGPDMIMDGITFGGGTFGTFGTVTMIVCELAIGIMFGGI